MTQDAPLARRKLPTIRTQILWVVNVSLAIAFAIILAFDYHRELAQQLIEEHGSLESDAAIHHEAIMRFRDHGMEHVQGYLDAVGQRPLDSYSRKHNHNMLLCVQGQTMMAPKGHPPPGIIVGTMEAASRSPDHLARFGDDELIVARYSKGDQTIYVADYVTNLQWWLLQDMMWRLAGISLVGILGALVVNLLLLRLIVRPLDRLGATVGQIGEGRLGVQTDPFRSAELEHLGQAINSMSRSLEEADRRHRYEMLKARKIQSHLLPGPLAIPGLKVAHLFLPATEVAGDYYDVLALSDGTWLLGIADVTGHGVPAAMTAAMLKALLLHAVEHQLHPAEILRFMDRRFTAMALPDDFASILLARWDPIASTLEYASAGHEPGWLLGPDGLHELPATGLPLGVAPEATWDSSTLLIRSGHRLVLLTDGLTEAFVPGQEMFGRKRLSALLDGCRTLPYDDVIPRVESELKAHLGTHTRPDDLTFVLIEFKALS